MMVFTWLFGGIDKKRDAYIADKLSTCWEIDKGKVWPVLLQIGQMEDGFEKGKLATLIAWQVDRCYKDNLAAFSVATKGVPDNKLNELKSSEVMKRIGREATDIMQKLDPHVEILSEEEAGTIISELEKAYAEQQLRQF